MNSTETPLPVNPRDERSVADFTGFVQGNDKKGQPNFDRLTGFVRNKGFAPQEAEDVVQDVLTETWDQLNFRGLVFTHSARAYIFRALHNAIIDRRRREEKKRQRGDGGLIDLSSREDLVEPGDFNKSGGYCFPKRRGEQVTSKS